MAGIIAETGRFLMGLRSASKVDQRAIYHFLAPSIDLKSRFRFEWHTNNQKLYVVDIALGEKTKSVVANLMAHNIDSQGAAYNAALCWCRGFQAASQGISHNDQGKVVILGEHS